MNIIDEYNELLEKKMLSNKDNTIDGNDEDIPEDNTDVKDDVKDNKDIESISVKKKKKKVEPKRVVFLTNDIKNKSSTIETFQKLCSKKDIKCYIADCRSAYITEKDDEVYIHNHDDEKGFLIKREDTVILNRRGISQSSYSKNLLMNLEQENFFCVNTLDAIKVCDDKFFTYQKLKHFEIDMPLTAIVSNEEHLNLALKNIGEKFPVVVKLLNGTQGIGVFICDSYGSLKSTLQAIWIIKPECDVIIQEKIDSDYDLRIHVLVKGNIYSRFDEDKDTEVIAAMKRIKIENDFRTNYSLGGTTEKVKLDKELIELASQVAKISGCTWCGVDIMIDKKTKKPYIIELNASPGTEGIEQTTGINVSERVLDFIVDKDNWCYPLLQVGFFEMMSLEKIGDFVAKFDTGNDTSACTLHCDEYKVNSKNISFKIGGKTYKFPLKGYITISKNHKNDDEDNHYKRPVFECDITFNGVSYEKYNIALSNRTGKSTPFLVNRNFMKEAGLIINPEKFFIVTTCDDKIDFENIRSDINKGFILK